MDSEAFEYISKGIQRVVPGQQVRIKGEPIPEEEVTEISAGEEEAEGSETNEGETTETEDAP